MIEAVDLNQLWESGYSIAELWGFTQPVSRGGPATDNDHLILWGILSIVEDQVSHGAGHRYLRDRLWDRDWIVLAFWTNDWRYCHRSKMPNSVESPRL